MHKEYLLLPAHSYRNVTRSVGYVLQAEERYRGSFGLWIALLRTTQVGSLAVVGSVISSWRYCRVSQLALMEELKRTPSQTWSGGSAETIRMT